MKTQAPTGSLRRNLTWRAGLTLAAALFGLLPRLDAGAADQRSMVGAERVTISIDGVAFAGPKSWSGGDPRGIVGSGPARRIAGVEFAPLVLEFELALPPAIQNWISDFCANRATAKKIILTQSDISNRPVESNEIDDAVLTQVTFSQLDGASKSAATVTLVIRPGYRQKIGPTDLKVAAGSRARTVPASNFRFTVPGLPSTRVGQIEEFTITRGNGGVSPGNLLVTLASIDAQPWLDWRDKVLGFGPEPTVNPVDRTADLTFLGQDMVTEILNLHFDGVGIVGVAPTGQPGGIARVQVELACGSITLAAAKVTAASGTSAPAPATPPGATAPAPDKTPAPAAAANTSPSDLGARDPKGFPRPEGMVRQSYTSLIVPKQARETAGYSSTLDYEKVLSNYMAVTKAEGWKETSRSESGNTPAERLMMIEWKKDLAVASVRIYGKEKGATSLVDITTQTP